jgi:preprotein translocase subunit SecE
VPDRLDHYVQLGGAVQREVQPLYFLSALPLALAFSFLLVNHPHFADYLIGVQDELRQFVWPRPAALVRGCLLVVAAIATVTIAVVGFDLLIWVVLLLVSA